jgi:hypothetical protein
VTLWHERRFTGLPARALAVMPGAALRAAWPAALCRKSRCPGLLASITRQEQGRNYDLVVKGMFVEYRKC